MTPTHLPPAPPHRQTFWERVLSLLLPAYSFVADQAYGEELKAMRKGYTELE